MPLWTPQRRRLYRPAAPAIVSGPLNPATLLGVSDYGFFLRFNGSVPGAMTINRDGTGGSPTTAGDLIKRVYNLGANGGYLIHQTDAGDSVDYQTSPFPHGNVRSDWGGDFLTQSGGRYDQTGPLNIYTNAVPCITAIWALRLPGSLSNEAAFFEFYREAGSNDTATNIISMTTSGNLKAYSKRAAGDSLASVTSPSTYFGSTVVVTMISNPGSNALTLRVNGSQVATGAHASTGNFPAGNMTGTFFGASSEQGLPNFAPGGWDVAAVFIAPQNLGGNLAATEAAFASYVGL